MLIYQAEGVVVSTSIHPQYPPTWLSLPRQLSHWCTHSHSDLLSSKHTGQLHVEAKCYLGWVVVSRVLYRLRASESYPKPLITSNKEDSAQRQCACWASSIGIDMCHQNCHPIPSSVAQLRGIVERARHSGHIHYSLCNRLLPTAPPIVSVWLRCRRMTQPSTQVFSPIPCPHIFRRY